MVLMNRNMQLAQSCRELTVVDTLICVWFVAKETWNMHRNTLKNRQNLHRKVTKNIKLLTLDWPVCGCVIILCVTSINVRSSLVLYICTNIAFIKHHWMHCTLSLNIKYVYTNFMDNLRIYTNISSESESRPFFF